MEILLSPAFWSAVAALAAAFASITMVRIQRRHFFEAVRPELVLIDWQRKTKGEGDSARDVIFIGTIRNVGQGVALNLRINARERSSRDLAVMGTSTIPILAQNESASLNAAVDLFWKDALGSPGNKHMWIHVIISCWDSRSIRHETVYNLFVNDDPNNPGVEVSLRTTTSKSMWKLKVLRLRHRILSPAVSTFRWIAGLSGKLRRQHPGG